MWFSILRCISSILGVIRAIQRLIRWLLGVIRWITRGRLAHPPRPSRTCHGETESALWTYKPGCAARTSAAGVIAKSPYRVGLSDLSDTLGGTLGGSLGGTKRPFA